MNEDKIFIGTSGYSYPNCFDEGGFFCGIKRPLALNFYAQNFNFLEINYSFYHQPTPKTFLKWKISVPDNFKFALKIHRYFTHLKRLTVDDEFRRKFSLFLENCQVLKPKLGPLLFQLPPSLKFSREPKNSTLDKLVNLAKILPKAEQIVFEVRHTSWLCEEVLKLFRQNNWCFCISNVDNRQSWAGDLPSGFFPSEGEFWQTADWGTYFRFHGSQGKYKGCHGTEVLSKLAQHLIKLKNKNLISFVAFNNTADGCPTSALVDGVFLKSLF